MLVIIYLLEDEQELSLGMLIRPKRIYNFCLLHATFGWYCYDIHTLPYTFDHIWTNLLIQCTPVPVSVFGCFCISGFHVSRTAQKNPEKLYKKSAIRKQHCVWRAAWGGGTPGLQAPWRRAPPGPRRGGAWAPRGSPGALLWHIFKGSSVTLRTGLLFAIPSLFRRRRRFQDREHQENSSRYPAGGEDHHRELLHHHGRLPDDSWVFSLGPWVHD